MMELLYRPMITVHCSETAYYCENDNNIFPLHVSGAKVVGSMHYMNFLKSAIELDPYLLKRIQLH